MFSTALKRLRKFSVYLVGLKKIVTRKNLAKYLPVIVTMCFLLIMTGVTFSVMRHWERERFLSNFESHSNHLDYALQTNFSSHIEVLYSVESLYYSSSEVTRQEFQTFVGRYLSRHPGIQALEWIPRVPANERASFEEAANLDGYPEFQITERQTQGKMIPVAKRNEYFPVYYVEPYEGNEIALGFDLASNPTRLEGLNQARDTGEATATARITLVQETSQQYGILIYVPIYSNGTNPSTIEERQQNLQGFALGVFRIGDVVNTSMDTGLYKNLEVELYDETAPVGEQLLYASQPNAEHNEYLLSDSQREKENPNQVEQIASFDLAGRQWSLRITPTSDYLATSHTWYPWAALLVGLIFTSLIGYSLLVRMKNTLNMEKLAGELSVSNLELREEVDRRREVEKTLRKSEERYRNLFDNAHDLIQSVSSDGRFLYVNNAWRQVLGYSEEEIRNLNLLDIIHPDSKNHCMELFKKVMSGEAVSNVQAVFVTKDGTPISLDCNAHPSFEGGNLVATQGIFRDVTQRKQAEEARLKTEKNFRRSLDDSPMGIRIVNSDGGTAYANRAMLDIYGYASIEELQAVPVNKRYTPESYAEHQMRKEKRLRGEYVPSNYEISIIRKNGEIRQLEVFRTEVLWNSHTQFQVLYNDITERKQAEDQYRLLANHSADVIYKAIIEDQRFTYVSPSIKQMLGYTDEEALTLGIKKMLTPESDEKQNHEMLNNFKSGVQQSILQLDAIHKDGSIIPIEVHTRFINDENGQPIEMVGVARDITERKRMEEERLELERIAQVSGRLASVGKMAAGIAHEINNPLTPILGFAEMLMKRDLPEDVKADLQIIYDSAKQTAGVTRRLLTFARQSKPMRTLCNVNEVIETTIHLRAYHLKTSGIKVVTKLEPELPKTMADAGQLQQVMLNLIMNAEYEMIQDHGCGNLLIKTEKIGNIIRVSLTDDGLGISKENMEKLFTPFFTTKKVGEGTGLGLSVCYGIVAEHNGRIYAESKVGKGATFIVELPIVSQQREEEAKPFESDAGEAGKSVKVKILVVDDEPTVTQVLKRVLTEEGYEVKAADTAKEALRLIEGGKYALILLDIKLPDMSGIELYQHLEKTDKSSTQRIIFVTGDAMGTDTMDFFSRTGAAYITKPFEIEQLKKEVKNKLIQK